jgi:hypothetical protein
MAISKIVLECPFCSQIFESNSPDKLHIAYSLNRPIANIFHGRVLKKSFRCENPKCRKRITIYWYAPLDYFNRI